MTPRGRGKQARAREGPAAQRMPARLYKYRSVAEGSREFTESIFRNNSVWYARASSFNDPFDCNHQIQLDLSVEEWVQQMERFQKKLGAGLGGLVGRFVGVILGELTKRAIEKGKLPPKFAIDADKGEAWGRKFGAHAELSRDGQRVVDLPHATLVGRDGVERPAVEALNRLYRDSVEQSRRDIDGRYGVFSLSSLRDNILMWSHYASEHRGICIEFDTERCADAFPNLRRITYREASPVITQRFGNLLLNLGTADLPELETAVLHMLDESDLSESWAEDEVRAWFLTKSRLWRYESEWRSLKRAPGAKRIPAAAISGVVVGCVDTEATLELVRGWVRRRRRKVALYRAVKRPGTFSLDIVPVDESRTAVAVGASRARAPAKSRRRGKQARKSRSRP